MKYTFETDDAQEMEIISTAIKAISDLAAKRAQVTEIPRKALPELVRELPVTRRVWKTLEDAEIVSVSDLLVMHPNTLRTVPNFGSKSMNEVREVLALYGVEWRGWL